MKNQSYYLQRAAQFNLLADFYKYMNPALHIQYYQKHLEYLNKAMLQSRSGNRLNPVYVRFLNATKEIANIDIYTNGRMFIKELPFSNITPYYTLHAGKHHLDIYPAGTQTATIINKNIGFETNRAYTLATVSTNDKIQILSYEDLPTSSSQETKVKFIHLTSDYPSVNVFFKNKKVLFENIGYKKSSDYTSIERITTNIEVVDRETDKVIQTLENADFSTAKTFSIFFVDSQILLI
ncbi:hypothetical protein AN964_09845 [Heyndrickxia shackletonii]|uniref:DUF4397 domain-containing protein n=1 Tax=Heyndrickxia shackletonii TaxID=157838 RepID=A0A0Q3WXM0_9BACI|nr:DUF4397 domain-containing protein [Heyndrickxia shackletonii]KQL53772.1 hypothetical protein AN964_09845 [Heyndrickxia shackletonii]NEY99924.1 DUF4397 domain-containing protein [Heyndrickxia shackletonii]